MVKAKVKPMKKKQPKDFEKVKNKVGKAKKAPRNETQTDFKAVRINMPHQNAIAAKTDVGRRNMNLTDLLGHVKHHNVGMRSSSFSQLRELLTDSGGLLQMHLGSVVEATSLAVLDSVAQVRKEYRSFLRWLLSEVSVDLQPFYPFLHLQIKASLTHVDAAVRRDGLVLLELFLAHPEGPRVVRGCVALVIELLIKMGSSTSKIEVATLRTLRHLLALYDERQAESCVNDFSIHDMLSKTKKKHGDSTSGLADLAVRAYMEAGECIEGLQLKLNACALLEKVRNPPWDDIHRRLFSEFPLSSRCPPGTNRAAHTALVHAINLHLAQLVASSPSTPSSSSRPAPLAYLSSVAKQLRTSNTSAIDEDDTVALQSVEAKVAHVVNILRLEVARTGAQPDSASIIAHLCLPKKDTAAELTSSRVLLMVPFVSEVYRLFDHDTALPWLQTWPKILWNSSKCRPELLREILALAKSDAPLFEKIQALLIPFYSGMGDHAPPILACSREDQCIAVSILFYVRCKWDALTPKITPLLQNAALDDDAKKLLADILLTKDMNASLKLRLLLHLMLESDDGWRRAATYTMRYENYWTSLACPLAQRAREVEAKSAHNWLRYLIACARPTSSEVLINLLNCVSICPDDLRDDFIDSLYTAATCTTSEVYEVACKQCFAAKNPRLLEALILNKKMHHDLSTENWGKCAPILPDNPVVHATVAELRSQLRTWDVPQPLLPMI